MRTFIAFFFALLLAAVGANAADTDYKDLKAGKARLDYGEAITIQGKTEEVTVGTPPTPLPSLMKPASLKLRYQVSGQSSVEKTGEINEDGKSFSAPVDKLPENSKVTFTFIFGGNLSADFVANKIQKLLTDPTYADNVKAFFDKANKQKPDEVKKQSAAFAASLLPLVLKDVPGVVKVTDAKTLADNMTDIVQKLTDAQRDSIVNMPTYRRMAIESLKVSEDTLAADLFRAAQAAKGVTAGSIPQYIDSYNTLQNLFSSQVQVSADVAADIASAGVKDFEKFAGVDVGTIYIPRIQELRAFFTVNIYWGTVEENPAPAPTEATKWAAFGNAVRQRLSLSVGMSVKDLSGRSDAKSQLSSNNAFMLGLGWRLNKYFRFTAGDALIRDKASNKIGHALFIGPSIDVSAIQNLRTLLGKVK